MARADHGMGEKTGHQTVARGNPDEGTGQDTLADEIRGDNRLQGEDQQRFRNQRQDQADSTSRTEGVVESYERQRPKPVPAGREKKKP